MARTKQLALDLRPSGWGGRRSGSGRKAGKRPAIAHRSREDFSARSPVHVTMKVREGLPSLRSVKLVREVERSFREVAERGDFRLTHYSIQRDHVHMIVEAEGREALGRGMRSIAARFGRAVNRVFARCGRVLRERYHMRVLRNPRQVRNTIAYVLLNAQKHAGRAFRYGRVDPASSARWFDGFTQGVEAARDAPAVAPPESWLLRIGWRRWGLIDLAHIPGST